MKQIFNCVILLSIGLVSCQSSKWDRTHVPGTWQSFEWIQLDSGNSVDQQLVFEFDSTDRYSIDYGSEMEVGKYWIAGEYLHTIEDGRAEKKVRIIQLSSDTMILEMNRSGFLEKLSLVKSKS